MMVRNGPKATALHKGRQAAIRFEFLGGLLCGRNLSWFSARAIQTLANKRRQKRKRTSFNSIRRKRLPAFQRDDVDFYSVADFDGNLNIERTAVAAHARHDVWQAGDSYDAYMGRWSRQIAPLFLDLLAVPSGVDWMEIGC